ncbi:MAG TPA: copper chaperone PCu(A)C [Burkholderiales bacterium]
MKWIATLFFFLCFSALAAEIEVRQPWARATPPGAKVAAGYLEIRNNGKEADRLLSASTPVAKRVEMHITQRDGEVVKMREVKSLDIPAGGTRKLEPGGTHLMLIELAQPLKQGERFRLRLRFERAGDLEADVEVRALGARQEHRH